MTKVRRKSINRYWRYLRNIQAQNPDACMDGRTDRGLQNIQPPVRKRIKNLSRVHNCDTRTKNGEEATIETDEFCFVVDICPDSVHSVFGAPQIIYFRGRQSRARGPNPAREFRPSGLRRLVSFNIKFGPDNVAYQTMSDCFHAEHNLVAH